MKNVLKGILIYESNNTRFKRIQAIVKLPMVLIILTSAVIGSIYVSFLKGFTS